MGFLESIHRSVITAACVLLAVLSTGCGQADAEAVYDMAMYPGYALVSDIHHAYFLAPGMDGCTEIDTFDQPLTADDWYLYRKGNVWTMVSLNRQVISCMETAGMDPLETVKEFEREAGIRLTLTSVAGSYADPYTKIEKTVYRAKAQALFDDEYYGIFSGGAAFIEADGTEYVLFSGTPNGAGADMRPLMSLFTKPYDLRRNASSTANAEDLSMYAGPVGMDQYGVASVPYKGTTACGREVLVKCTGAGMVDAETGEEIRQALGLETLPDPPDGMAWAWADLEVDYGNTDISEVLPAVGIKAVTEEGTAAGRTYMVDDAPDKKRCLFAVPEGSASASLLVGQGQLTISIQLTKGGGQ